MYVVFKLYIYKKEGNQTKIKLVLKLKLVINVNAFQYPTG